MLICFRHLWVPESDLSLLSDLNANATEKAFGRQKDNTFINIKHVLYSEYFKQSPSAW